MYIVHTTHIHVYYVVVVILFHSLSYLLTQFTDMQFPPISTIVFYILEELIIGLIAYNYPNSLDITHFY